MSGAITPTLRVSAPPGETLPPAELVDKLKELGISEKSAKYALSRAHNNVEVAANYVFSGNAGRDEVRDRSIERTISRPTLDPVPEHDVAEPSPIPITTATSRASSTTADSSDSDDDDDEEAEQEEDDASSNGTIGSRSRLLSSISSRLRPRRSTDGSSTATDDAPRGRRRDRIKARITGKQLTDIPTHSLGLPPTSALPTTTSASLPLPKPAPLIPHIDSAHHAGPSSGITFDAQASDLIKGALSNPGSRRGSGEANPKRTSGAIGMLAMKAAGTAVPRSPESTFAPVLQLPSQPVGSSSKATERGRRASSPFFRARRSRDEARKRSSSPDIKALPLSGGRDRDAESDAESVGNPGTRFRPQASAYEEDDDASEVETEDDADEPVLTQEEEELFNEDGDFFDEETSKNTSANAVYYEGVAAESGGTMAEAGEVFDNYGEEIEQDILGEGPNVVVPPEPLFKTNIFNQPPVKKETLKSGLELETSRPVYARDRCTMTLTHGEPDAALEASGKRLRRYVVLSDLSEESRYAVEWAVGTVARDGDELFVISVKEDESKVDPKQWSNSDRAQKLRVQKERQTTCLLLTRQVTGLLQRTRLNITVTCQFLHAKNARHMLLDLIDFLEPTMVIMGSRGLGKLKGILLGSTSHYLVQKSSVPIMVARRRLQRPLRHTNPADLRHAPRVSLASASIEKTASSKQEDEVVDVAETEMDGNKEETPDRRKSMPASSGM